MSRADPGCVQEKQAEAGSRLRPCQSLVVSTPKAEPLEGRTGAGGRTQAFTQAGRCLGRAGPGQAQASPAQLLIPQRPEGEDQAQLPAQLAVI